MVEEYSHEAFKEAAQEVLIPCSTYIRKSILNPFADLAGDSQQHLGYELKEDGSYVTPVDKLSEKIGERIIKKHFPNYRLNSEESGESGKLDSPITIYFDPLDGTASRATGGIASTVILAAYDIQNKKVLDVATMEPMSGRYWVSSRGQGTQMNVFDYIRGDWNYEDIGISLNSKRFVEKKGRVFIEHPHSYTLSEEGRGKLRQLIVDNDWNEATTLSNGAHYAQFSMREIAVQGKPGVAVGVITTAIGGPFDIAGLLHVTEAGGVAECYDIGSEAPAPTKELVPQEKIFGTLLQIEKSLTKKLIPIGQDIENAKFTIAAANEKDLKTLERMLEEAVVL